MRFPAVAGCVAALAVAGPVAVAADCDGVAVSIATVEPPAIGGPAIAAARDWERRSGGRATVVTFPLAELYPALITPLGTGRPAFDVMLHPLAWLGDLAPFLAPMPARLRNDRDFRDIAPVYRQRLMTWDGRVLAQIVSAEVMLGAYRRDLLDDPAEQAAFVERYGYALAAPTSWRQYLDIAEFFSRPEQGLHGTAEPYLRGSGQFRLLVDHAAGYANPRQSPGAMFFDPETMAAAIAAPGWRRGLEDYVASTRRAPPEALGWTASDLREAFVGGRLAMALGLDDAARPPKVEGGVGFFPLPGAGEVWHGKSRSWERLGRPARSPYVGAGGWVASVPVTTGVADCAWEWVAWLTRPGRSLEDAVTAGTGIHPYRLSHLADPEAWAAAGGLTETEAESYLAAQLAAIQTANPAIDPRIPGHDLYVGAAELEITRALAGEIEPQVALDAIARAWDRLTDDLGRARQLAAYRTSMGLPPR